MSRNPLLEALVEAIVDAQEAQPHEAFAKWSRANSMLAAASTRGKCTPEELRDALHDEVKEFRRQRKEMESLRVPPTA